jgi:hypothetical protein
MHPLDEHLRFAHIGSSSDTNFKNIEKINKQTFFFGGGGQHTVYVVILITRSSAVTKGANMKNIKYSVPKLGPFFQNHLLLRKGLFTYSSRTLSPSLSSHHSLSSVSQLTHTQNYMLITVVRQLLQSATPPH